MTIPPKGSMARDFAELAVRQRQLGRVILRDTPIGPAKAWLEGPGWWFFYAFSTFSLALAWFLGDPGLMLFIALIVLYGVWKRR